MAMQTFNPETCQTLCEAYNFGKTATKKQMKNYTKRVIKNLDKTNKSKKKKVRFSHQPVTVSFDSDMMEQVPSAICTTISYATTWYNWQA